jgi:NADH-quinone oxidoreductase subunit J
VIVAEQMLVAQNIFFWIFAVAMGIGAVRVVTTDDIVHAALWLVLVLAGGAAQFLLLGQEFVAWVQVLVYIGAVIVLFLFGIMLTRAPMQRKEDLTHSDAIRWGGLGVSLLLAVGLAGPLIDLFGGDHVNVQRPIGTDEVGNSIFRDFLVPFEVVGVLLLGALIGAVVLARRD